MTDLLEFVLDAYHPYQTGHSERRRWQGRSDRHVQPRDRKQRQGSGLHRLEASLGALGRTESGREGQGDVEYEGVLLVQVQFLDNWKLVTVVRTEVNETGIRRTVSFSQRN